MAASHSDQTEDRGWLQCGDHQLFACVHLPRSDIRASTIVCSPLFGEGMRNYRNEVWLARSLACMGIATLRFHYAGTGHSDGAAASLSLSAAVEDSVELLDRLVMTTGASTAVVVGTRLGAAIATELAVMRESPAIVLWDPVVDGQQYLQEQSRWVAIARLAASDVGRRGANTAMHRPAAGEVTDVIGYPMNAGLRDEIAAVDLRQTEWPSRAAVLVVEATPEPDLTPQAAQALDLWRGAGADVRALHIPREEGFWFVGDSWVRHRHDPVSRQLIEGTTRWLYERADSWI